MPIIDAPDQCLQEVLGGNVCMKKCRVRELMSVIFITFVAKR
ncbi:hypothetical protein HMPREF1121_01516 [Porphyromonas sp. KLE 1280]|nr:hypothetical protein HMPREF1121_01516 [Porphyromonas sp. KLE 1280]